MSTIQEAEGTIVKLTEVLSRIAEATPNSTNSRTAEDMTSWVYAVATTGLDIIKNRAAAPTVNLPAATAVSAESLTTLRAFRLRPANVLDLVDDGSLAKAIDEVLATLQQPSERITA